MGSRRTAKLTEVLVQQDQERRETSCEQSHASRMQTSALSSDEGDVLSDDALTARFELLELLGKGSYGSVYTGRARDSGELFAIKVLPLVEGVRRPNARTPAPSSYPRAAPTRRRTGSRRFGTRFACCRSAPTPTWFATSAPWWAPRSCG